MRLITLLIIIMPWFISTRHAIGHYNVQEISTPNGIHAWFIPEPQLKVVSVTFSFLGGAAYTSPKQRGLAALLAPMLLEGTQKRINSELKDYLLDHGIELSFSTTQDRFVVELRTTNNNMENAIAILREILHTPRFAEDDLQRLITAQKLSIEYQLAQPATQASFAHLQLLMANHPYTTLTNGTIAGLSHISVNDLRAYLLKIMARDSLIIGVCGNLDHKQIVTILDQLFADLPAKSPLEPLAIPIGNFQGQQQTLTSTNPQSIILFSQNGLGYTDPDFMKLYILNHIIGVGMTSRLWQVLRIQHGLVYDVGSNIQNYDKMKLLTGHLETKISDTGQAIDFVMKIWQDIKDNGVNESELADAKSYLLGSFPLMFSSTSQIANVLHAFQVNGIESQYFEKRADIIRNVTLPQINEFAKKFIDPKHLIVTVVQQPISSVVPELESVLDKTAESTDIVNSIPNNQVNKNIE